MEYELINPLVSEIKGILDTSRQNVAKAVNNELLVAYWKIGEIIVSYEQNDKVHAAYGFILLSYLLIDKVYKKMPPNRRLSKPQVLTI